MNPGQFGLEKLLKPWSSSSQFLAAPQGPWGLAGVLWAWALSISDSCLGEVEADTPFFSSLLSLSRCQHLKVNNIQEGSGVRATSGLSLSPQTQLVRAWIWPVWTAEKSWATAAPGLDTMSSAGAVTVTEKGAASWILGSVLACRPRAAGLVLWRPLQSKADSHSAGAKWPAKWTHNPSLKICGRGKRTEVLRWLTGMLPGHIKVGDNPNLLSAIWTVALQVPSCSANCCGGMQSWNNSGCVPAAERRNKIHCQNSQYQCQSYGDP